MDFSLFAVITLITTFAMYFSLTKGNKCSISESAHHWGVSHNMFTGVIMTTSQPLGSDAGGATQEDNEHSGDSHSSLHWTSSSAPASFLPSGLGR